MISYTGVRYIASYASGILAFVLLGCLMWIFTEWYIEAIFLWSMVGSLFVGGAMWILTEPKKKPRKWTPDCVPFYTIRKEDRK